MFWKTQNVRQYDENVSEDTNEEIKPLVISKVQKTETLLEENHVWFDIDPDVKESMNELYKFLSDNYVEDEKGEFRFEYSEDFLKWVFKQPNIKKGFLLSIKHFEDIVGFIGAFPSKIKAKGCILNSVEIDFLCVKKTKRGKGLAPILIKEITRRVNLEGISYAVYTSGTVIPTPFSTARYFHRQLNVRKLVSVGFSFVPYEMTLDQYEEIFNLKQNKDDVLFQIADENDVDFIENLFKMEQEKWTFLRLFSKEEIRYFFCNKKGVVSLISKELSAFISFYFVPIYVSSLNCTISCAYLFYHSAKNAEGLSSAVNSALLFCKKNNVDVFNCLNTMGNESFFLELGFVLGDGKLNFYIFNWKTSNIPKEKIFLSLF